MKAALAESQQKWASSAHAQSSRSAGSRSSELSESKANDTGGVEDKPENAVLKEMFGKEAAAKLLWNWWADDELAALEKQEKEDDKEAKDRQDAAAK